MYSVICRSDSKINLKGVSKSFSKNIKFDEYKNCLAGKDYQKFCENYLIRSLIYEMYLQKVIKNSLFSFDDKRSFDTNFKSKPWGWRL